MKQQEKTDQHLKLLQNEYTDAFELQNNVLHFDIAPKLILFFESSFRYKRSYVLFSSFSLLSPTSLTVDDSTGEECPFLKIPYFSSMALFYSTRQGTKVS